MPAKPAPTVKSSGLAPIVERQDAELTAAGRELADDLVASPEDEFSSPAERRSAERTARRRQQAEARDMPSLPGARVPQSRVVTPPQAPRGRASLPAMLIAVIAGGVLGLILGALSVGGWVIGLLVAGVTVIVLRALSPRSGATRGR